MIALYVKRALSVFLVLVAVSASIWPGEWTDDSLINYQTRRSVLVSNQFNHTRAFPVELRLNFTSAVSPACGDANNDSDLLDAGLDFVNLRVAREYANGTFAGVPFHVTNSTSQFACQNGGLNDFNLVFSAATPANETDDGWGNGTSQYWVYYGTGLTWLASNGTLATGLSNSGGGAWQHVLPYAVASQNSTGEYSVNVTMDTATPIVLGLMKMDCSDIRATMDGVELDYWVEDCTSADTTVWVKVPELNNLTQAPRQILLHYGNPSATSSADANQTFLFFDDFNGAAVNDENWTWFASGSSSASTSSGRARIYQASGEDVNFTLKNPFSLAGAALEFVIRYSNGWVQNKFIREDGQNATQLQLLGDGHLYALSSGPFWTQIFQNINPSTDYEVSFMWDSSQEKVRVMFNGNTTEFTPLLSAENQNLTNVQFKAEDSVGEIYLDQFRLRHYFHPEPFATGGFSFTLDCPKIFPWCCNLTEHYQNGVCCNENETCCTATEDCAQYEACDLRDGFYYCYLNKPSGIVCDNSTECASDYCNTYCCANQTPFVTEMGDCTEGAGGRCAYWDDGGIACCADDTDCPTGATDYFCHTGNFIFQCLECASGSNGICSSSNCIGTDADCCATDSDCSTGKWCSDITCTQCANTIDFNCPTSKCLGYDPDCCNAANPCPVGLICDTSRSPNSCTAPVGDSCDDDFDCRGSSVCRASTCVLDEFVVVESTDYASTLGETLLVYVNVLDPLRQRGTYKATVEGSGRNFVRFQGALDEYTFTLDVGETKRLPLTFTSGALGNYEVRVKVWNLQKTAVISTETFSVNVQGRSSAPLMMSAPGLDLSACVVLAFLAACLYMVKR